MMTEPRERVRAEALEIGSGQMEVAPELSVTEAQGRGVARA